MTSGVPMYLTFVSVGSDMIDFTGHPRIAFGNPLNGHPKPSNTNFSGDLIMNL